MHTLSILSTLVLLASVATGHVVPRKETPATYAVGYLESYQVYHTRYLALGCQHHHHSRFFKDCCHPLLANETLDSRPGFCTPSSTASSSASAAEATPAVKTPADSDSDSDSDDDDSDSDDDSGESPSSSHRPTSTHAVHSKTSESVSSPSATNKPSTTSTPTHTSTEETTTPTASSSAKPAPVSDVSDSSASSSQVFTGGIATWFDQNGNAGACGQVHPDSALIVALDQRRYGDSSKTSPYCGKTVAITAYGKTVNAIVADDCPTCVNSNCLDMSQGLFKEFAPLSVGEFDITWQFLN